MLKKILIIFIVVITVILSPIVYLTICEYRYSRYLDEVSTYPPSNIVKIQIISNRKEHALDKKYYQDFVEQLKTLKETYKIGYAGEQWHYYETMKIDWGKYGKFNLFFSTRDSLGDRMIMDYVDKSYFMTFSTSEYEATNFYKWLIEKGIFEKDMKNKASPFARIPQD